MNHPYTVRETSAIYTPALLFYKDMIVRNIARLIEIAGGPERLRPHVKTHKTREIVRLELQVGINKHKCATIAEAEMLAQCGVPDIFLAYNPVGPNCRRMGELVTKYPDSQFSVTGDHPAALRSLSAAIAPTKRVVGVFLDLDVGQHRTGMAVGEEAAALYELIGSLPGLRAVGFQVYDGHNHQESLEERQASVRKLIEPVLALRARLEKKGLSVPRMITGGTPTFPVFARMDLPGLECSPGTCVLHDSGYGSKYPDVQGFTPAAVLLTRVMSRPTARRVTLDLGYKAVASDPPAGKRCILLNVPDYEPVLQNEEHFVVETPAAERFQPGDEVYAIPTHICPTCALHKHAYVIENGTLTGTWEIAARDRILTL